MELWKKDKRFDFEKDTLKLRKDFEKFQTQLMLSPNNNSLWMQEKDSGTNPVSCYGAGKSIGPSVHSKIASHLETEI